MLIKNCLMKIQFDHLKKKYIKIKKHNIYQLY